jgi:AcrR family transcriptional regulator
MAKRAAATNRTRGRIEKALVRLLASKPYSSVTMADIAGEADVSVRTVQRHYRSKDELLASCARMPAQALSDELARRPAASSPQQAIRDLIEALFAVYDRHSAEIWAIYSRAGDVPVLQETVSAGTEARVSCIERLIGRWPDVWALDREQVRWLMQAMTSYLTWRAFTQGGQVPLQEAAAGVAMLLTRSLLHGYRMPSR